MICLDDDIEDAPKFVDLSADSFLLWIFAIGYCRRKKTDGYVPESVARRMIRSIGDRARSLEHVVAELLRKPPSAPEKNPLWTKVPGGYQIHDYLTWNPSKDQVKEKMEKRRLDAQKAGVASAARRLNGRPTTTDRPVERSSIGEKNGRQPRSVPVPVPVPDPAEPEPQEADATTAGVLEELRRHPKLAPVATVETARKVSAAVLVGLRLEDALAAIDAVAFDIPDGAEEGVVRRMYRVYMGKAKVYGDRARAADRGPSGPKGGRSVQDSGGAYDPEEARKRRELAEADNLVPRRSDDV